MARIALFGFLWLGAGLTGMAYASGPFTIPDGSVACGQVGTTQASGAKRTDCVVSVDGKPIKTVHFLNLYGAFPYQAYDHGKLLANETHDSLLTDVSEKFEGALKRLPSAARPVARRLADCLGNKMWVASTPEFRNAIRAFRQGYTEKLSGNRHPYSDSEIRTGAVGIEQATLVEGMLSRLEDYDVAKDLVTCGVSAAGKSALAGLKFIFRFFKFGCLGFVAPEANVAPELGSLLHARNFDTDMNEAWGKHPTVFLSAHEGRFKYLSIAASGMVYNGGISGINEAGLAVSIHELSTTRYKMNHAPDSAAVAPFIQQRILREASSIDEAWAIVRKVGVFGAWTILVSDAKTGEAASLEFSGQHKQLLRRSRGDKSISQANHFIGSEMQDQFYEHSYNKTLESRSRFNVTQNLLDQGRGKIDVDYAMDILAAHTDEYEGFRSFGRVNVKAYTIASTIALAKKNQMWFTVNDVWPAAHGHYMGVEVDWKTMSVKLLGIKRVNTYDSKPNWLKSLTEYIRAKEAVEEGDDHLKDAVGYLDNAISLAQKDGVTEFPYYFMRARILFDMASKKLTLGNRSALDLTQMAHEAWDTNRVMVVGDPAPQKVHPYTKALTFLYWIQSRDLLVHSKRSSTAGINPKTWGAVRRLLIGTHVLPLLMHEWHSLGYRHQALDNMIDYAIKLSKDDDGVVKMPSIEFVTVE